MANPDREEALFGYCLVDRSHTIAYEEARSDSLRSFGNCDLRPKKNKITGELFAWFRSLCSKGQPKTGANLILSMQEQVKAWRKASQKMGWKITDNEFDRLEARPSLKDEDRTQGFMGAVLFWPGNTPVNAERAKPGSASTWILINRKISGCAPGLPAAPGAFTGLCCIPVKDI